MPIPETLPILYRDDHMVAVNKPAGLLVHRSAIDRYETRFAVQILRDQLGQQVFPIHRLDKPTSGVLLFALSSGSAQKMGETMREHRVAKTYVAVVRGYAPDSGTIDHPLKEERDKCSDRKMRDDKPAQPAVTEFKRLATIELPIAVDKYPCTRYSLVACYPQTGRKHQLRRHLKHINHPIIGDPKHGKSLHNRFFQTQFSAHRLMLAATELTFPHPHTDQLLNITAPLDDIFCGLLREFDWYNAVPSGWLEQAQHATG